MTTDQNSTERMREEILADARRECEQIIIRAKRDAEVSLNNATTEADRLRQERLDQAHGEASRKNELILATVSVETGRLRAARVEALLESVCEEARERLQAREGFDYQETVISLTADAIKQMEGDAFIVKLSKAEQTVLGDGLAGEIARRVGRTVNITIKYAEEITESGVVVEDAEARQVWDNRLVKRLERLWPTLRRQIAVDASFVPKTASGGDAS
jgi:vacuolar-type H+-ATPase subunit E/Vma4